MSFADCVTVAPGRQLFVRDEGRGAPLLLLHGFTGSGATMNALRQNFSPRFRVLSVDLLGHGQSDAPADVAPYQMETCVADLCAVLEARAVARTHLVGYSLGARVALALALWAPERVASVVAVAARAGIADPKARRQRIAADEALARDIETRGLEWFVAHWMALPLFASQRRLGARFLAEARRQRLANNPRGLAMSLRGLGVGAQPPLAAALGGLRCPLLLVTGEDDPRFGAHAAELAARVRGAKKVVLPEAGHAAHLENFATFQRVCFDFLAAQGVAAAAQSQHHPPEQGARSCPPTPPTS